MAPQPVHTDFHASYFAHELTKRSASDNVEKLAAVLADAQVDLNPHQVEAAYRRASDLGRQPDPRTWPRARGE